LQSDRTSKNIVCFIFELKLSWPLKQVFSIVLQQIISRNTSQRIQLKSIHFLTLLSVIRKPGSMSYWALTHQWLSWQQLPELKFLNFLLLLNNEMQFRQIVAALHWRRKPFFVSSFQVRRIKNVSAIFVTTKLLPNDKK
jgi:hypothetical protein